MNLTSSSSLCVGLVEGLRQQEKRNECNKVRLVKINKADGDLGRIVK